MFDGSEAGITSIDPWETFKIPEEEIIEISQEPLDEKAPNEEARKKILDSMKPGEVFIGRTLVRPEEVDEKTARMNKALPPGYQYRLDRPAGKLDHLTGDIPWGEGADGHQSFGMFISRKDGQPITS